MVIINDNILPPEQLFSIRQSALQAGFGTWSPSSATFGSGKYEGMGYQGNHSPLICALTQIMGRPVFPNSMFFRITNEGTEKRYIHSDADQGAFTCLVYLSDHDEISGTAFFKNKKYNILEMPSIEEMTNLGIKEDLGEQMVSGREEDWEKTDFVFGHFGRSLIFSAPQFHARCPDHGIGTDAETGRLIWACHFYV